MRILFAGGGTGVTVDGTEANSNPEERSLAQYGGQNQISVMSLDAIAEIRIVKGVLPAEYGNVAGGQINVISRSGTNVFHGVGFEGTGERSVKDSARRVPGEVLTEGRCRRSRLAHIRGERRISCQ